jgi:hypothetical protein
MGIERKVTGLENLVTQVEDARSTLKILEREIAGMELCSGDSQKIERLIDERTAEYRNNAIVMTMVQEFKARMRARTEEGS